jgi:3-dehydroquinate synthase
MRKLVLQAPSGSCTIALGESIDSLGQYCKGAGKAVVITDSNVSRLHGGRLKGVDVIVMEPGEGHKTLETVGDIVAKLLELEADRSTLIVGVGGGIVCDVAGFVASTYMRGVRSGFVPTTLLAQVDASVGGKNGVNFRGYKNIIGTIRQPEFCLCDFGLLATLPKAEMQNGFAEAVKSAAIGDAALFSFLEGNWKKASALQRTAIEKVVHDSLQVKMRIVAADEREGGERMKLNFGHTIGHAIEKATGMPHGAAISVGMAAAADLSVKRAGLPAAEAERLKALLTDIGLPIALGAGKEGVLGAIRKDKKRFGAKVRMVLLERTGSARISDVGLEDMEAIVNDMR